jgi:outer membrane receptor protein involved in Fe transport
VQAANGIARLLARLMAATLTGALGAAALSSQAAAGEPPARPSFSPATMAALDRWAMDGWAPLQIAQQADAAPEDEAVDPLPGLPPVIVTDRKAPPAMAVRAEAVEPRDVILREDFVNTPAPLRINDVAKRLPGVLTGGGPGEDKEARVFGLDKEFTRTTVNGVPIPDGGEKREFNLDRLPVGMVREVEVIRNRTAAYEADGLAGVVNIKTREIPLQFAGEIDLGAGFLDANDDMAGLASGTLGGRIGERFGLLGSVAYNRVPITKEKGKWRANGVLSEREYEDKPTDSIDAMLDAAIYYDGGEVHFEPIYLELDEDKDKLKEKFNGAGIFNGSETEAEDKVKRTIGGTIRQEHDFDFGLPGGRPAELAARIGYFHTIEDKTKEKRVFNAAGIENLNNRELESEDKTDAIGFVQSDLKLPMLQSVEHTPQIGFLLRQRDREKLKDKFVGGVARPDAKGRYTLLERYYAGYLLDEIRPTDWLTLTPGLRVEYVTLKSEDGASNIAHSDFLDFLPSLPVAIAITDEITYRASVARLVNRPKFDELAPFADDSTAGKLVIGNPQLKPARAWAFETSLGYADDEMGFEIGLFHREIKDVIESVATGEIIAGDTVEQVRNVGDGHVQGITLS